MSRSKLILSAALFGFFLLLLYQFGMFVMVLWLNFKNPSSSAFMDSAKASAANGANISYQWVPYDQISNHLKSAVITAEDAKFMSHGGVEWEAIKSAWEYNRQQASSGTTKRRGGSTITQQLAKNLFLSEKRSYLRKLQELVLAYMIELVMSKKRILELYLNIAQWGELTFGVEAASKKYYKVSATHVSANQAARLAAMLPNPRYYEKNGNTPFLQRRTNSIRAQMHMVAVP